MMATTINLLRRERTARVFFATLLQSALGTGAGAVALVLLAYERYHSPWAISLVLIADLLPAMALGPVFGALADRFSRRACLIAADVLRAGAALAIAVVPGFPATLIFAGVMGIGTALFTPAALAALPSLVDERLRPAATSLYGAATDAGYTAGPAMAALLLVAADAGTVMVVNAVTFAVSACVLASLAFGPRPERSPPVVAGSRAVLREAREGLRATWRQRGLPMLLGCTAAVVLFGGLLNVAELPYAIEDLLGGSVVFAVLYGAYGVGFAAGSLLGASGGSIEHLRRRWLEGLLLIGFGLVASGLAPVVPVAALTFAVAGCGNGVTLVYERLLIQASVPDQVAGRVFGVKDALTAWAFGLGFLAAGALVPLIGPRETILAAGCGGLLVWLGAALATQPEAVSALGGGAYPARHGAGGQKGT
jgi:MFS transporter